MELTAPSLPMVFCDGFCLGSGPFFMVCSVVFCSCVVDTHIWPGDVHFCPTLDWSCSLCCHPHCTGFCAETFCLFFSFSSFTHRIEPLSIMSATSEGKKELVDGWIEGTAIAPPALLQQHFLWWKWRQQNCPVHHRSAQWGGWLRLGLARAKKPLQDTSLIAQLAQPSPPKHGRHRVPQAPSTLHGSTSHAEVA